MAETEAAQVEIPIKVPEPEDKAPPALAEPASGPAAEMSGALSADSTAEVKSGEIDGESGAYSRLFNPSNMYLGLTTTNGAAESASEAAQLPQEPTAET